MEIAIRLEMLPALNEKEINEFEEHLPCRLPAEVREVLHHCRGFFGAATEPVDFTGRNNSFEMLEIFPHGIPIAADGYGNFWVVDLLPDSKDFSPIYFACHDAPVILLQSLSLQHFLVELFKLSTPPYQSVINDVHDDLLFDVLRKNPAVRSYEDCLTSGDSILKDFAESLDTNYEFADLRNSQIGFGFSWGRYGPDLDIRRCGTLPIFAVMRKKGFFKRFFR